MKGVGLWGKGDRLRDEGKNTIRTLLYQHVKETKIALFSLKGVGLWEKAGKRCSLLCVVGHLSHL